MKQKTFAILLTVLIVALVLFVPIRRGQYDDGGTEEYVALTYRIVIRNRFHTQVDENGTAVVNEKYSKTSVYLFPYNLKTIDELWQIEPENSE